MRIDRRPVEHQGDKDTPTWKRDHDREEVKDAKGVFLRAKWFYTGDGGRTYVGPDMSAALEILFQCDQGKNDRKVEATTPADHRPQGTILYEGGTYERYADVWHRIEDGKDPLPLAADEATLAAHLEKVWGTNDYTRQRIVTD